MFIYNYLIMLEIDEIGDYIVYFSTIIVGNLILHYWNIKKINIVEY